jgi:uncharacterized protein YdeI (YjbR/CyaY-like superfamily)
MATTPVFFPDARAWRTWLRQHHATATELVLRLAKVHVAHVGLTYAEALDEALCFGWIDGITRGVDADTFAVRFTPRRPRSAWSQPNVQRVQRLTRQKRMTKAGLGAFSARDESRGRDAQGRGALSSADVRRFRAEPKAWAYFQGETPSYRRGCLAWLADAKRAETRERRLLVLIECSGKGGRIPLYPARRREATSGRRAVVPG